MNSCENTEITVCSVHPLRADFSAADAEISNDKIILKANYSKHNIGTLPNRPLVPVSKLYLHSSNMLCETVTMLSDK